VPLGRVLAMKLFVVAFLVASAANSITRAATWTKQQAVLRASTENSDPHQVNCNCLGAGGSSETNPEAAKAAEVVRLSDEMDAVSLELQKWRLKIAKAKDYFKGQEKLLRDQIEVRKEIANSSSAADAKDEAYYASRICAKIVGSRVLGDKSAEVEFQEMCMGRTHLALPAFRVSSSSSTFDASNSAAPCRCARSLGVIDASQAKATSLLARSRRRDAATQGNPQKLKDLVAKLKRQVETTREEYFSDLKTQKAALEKLDEEEAKLANTASNQHADRQKAENEAWLSARDKACAAINGGAHVADVCG